MMVGNRVKKNALKILKISIESIMERREREHGICISKGVKMCTTKRYEDVNWKYIYSASCKNNNNCEQICS